MRDSPLVFLTGASGYVGGRLLKRLEAGGHRLRCLARRPEELRDKVGPGTEVVGGDVLDATSLAPALAGADVAFYLVHSMGSEGSFVEQDRRAARNFALAAKEAGVSRVIYLGGLGRDEEDLSPHLRSRHEVGEILRASGPELLEFRASIVIGAGSLSFEMIRSLVERLPVMVTPKWVKVPAQPIAIDDLLDYLAAAIALPAIGSRVYEIGGADRVCYADIMQAYARQRGRRLRMIPVPVLTPFLSSLWLGLVTPLYARVGRKLIESIVHPTVVVDESARRDFPDIRPVGVEEAVRRALATSAAAASPRWSDAQSAGGAPRSWDGAAFGARLKDERILDAKVSPDAAFRAISRIGGDNGWYAWNTLWRIRGFLDLLVGGVGLRRGRSHPEVFRVGDTVDFWRVESIGPGHKVRLAAEMKLPGRAWLEFEVTETAEGCAIRQTAFFDPVAPWGRPYWFALYPLHHLVFGGMLRGIARAAV